MTSFATLTSVNETMKDFFPAPGTRIKQYVVDMRKGRAWEVETCPRIEVPAHIDNTGMGCAASRSLWIDLQQAHCCHFCGDLAEATADRDDVVAWLARTDRPAVTADRAALSDEVAPDLSLRDHPLFRMTRKP
jgi:hypothetical protein